MKFISKKVFLSLIVFCSLFVLFAKDSQTNVIMYVSLDPAPLKEKASAVSKDVGSIEYATPVYVLEEKKSWMLVCPIKDDSISGWIPSTYVTKKKLKANDISATANAEEIALAGKGFVSAIEACYAEAYDLDYSDVNFMETYAYDDLYELLEFAHEGNLFLGETE